MTYVDRDQMLAALQTYSDESSSFDDPRGEGHSPEYWVGLADAIDILAALPVVEPDADPIEDVQQQAEEDFVEWYERTTKSAPMWAEQAREWAHSLGGEDGGDLAELIGVHFFGELPRALPVLETPAEALSEADMQRIYDLVNNVRYRHAASSAPEDAMLDECRECGFTDPCWTRRTLDAVIAIIDFESVEPVPAPRLELDYKRMLELKTFDWLEVCRENDGLSAELAELRAPVPAPRLEEKTIFICRDDGCLHYDHPSPPVGPTTRDRGRNGAILACGCWTPDAMPGMRAGSDAVQCPNGHRSSLIAEANIDEFPPPVGPTP